MNEDEQLRARLPADEPGPSVGTPVHELRRSRTNRVLAGVCGGLGAYLGVDPVLLRIVFVLLAFAGGGGILLYLVAWILIPEAREGETIVPAPHGSRSAQLIIGGVFILLGVFWLVREFVPWFDDRVVWAIILIAVGAAVVARGVRR